MRPRNPNLANDYLEYIGEYQTICKTALARESGAWGDVLDEKKARIENPITLSL
jgi:hypothetical protein